MTEKTARLLFWPAALAFLAMAMTGPLGCATLYSETERMDLGAFYLIESTPERVSQHCHKMLDRAQATYDNGAPIAPTDEIRACTVTKRQDGKPTIFGSRKWRACYNHEACHALRWGNPAYCAAVYPCRGEDLQ